MKGTKTLSLLVIVTFIASSMVIPGVSAVDEYTPPPPIGLWATDYEVTDQANLVGNRFNVSVNLYNITWLGAIGFSLYYNTTLLDAEWCYLTPMSKNYLSDYGPLDPINYSYHPKSPINDTLGRVLWFAAVKVFTNPFTGNASVLTIEFSISIAPPLDTYPTPQYRTVSCPLHLNETTLGWINPTTLEKGDYILNTDYGLADGLYKYTRPQIVAGAPVAEFSWSPAIPYESDTVTLDASPSTPNGGSITDYEWWVSGDATLTGPYDTKVTTMHCDGPGTAIVELWVWDSEGMYDWVEHTITQLEVTGAIIDLYTSENRFCGQTTTGIGTGPDQPCDALSPDVNVTLFAKVTWGGAPVMHSLVAFEVRWMEWIDWQIPGFQPVPKDECVLYRTAETDKDGVARIWFRVPTPCPGHMFGKWLAIATCKVQEQKIEDTMPFDVGYLLTIIDGSLMTTETEYVREQDRITVRVKLKNIAWMDKDVTLVFTFYDDCDVPIGQCIYTTTVDGGVYCNPLIFQIEKTDAILVPQWAYVGVGKVYVSAFTALPKDCGVPYCPEKSTTFVIKYVP